MKEWFNSLSQRDKQVLIGGGLVASVLLSITFIIAPFAKSLANLKQDVNYQRTLLAWMQSAEKQLSLDKQHDPYSPANGSILEQASTAISKVGLNRFKHEIQQSADGGARITFKQAPYPYVIKMLNQMTNHNAVEVTMLMMSLVTPGVVQCEILLKSTKSRG